MIVDVEQAIRDYLPQTVHMSLATARDNKPWVCEVHFAWDEDLHLYFRSLLSRRHSQEIADNAQVAGNIIVQHVLGLPVRGVYFEGEARLLVDEEEKARAAGILQERLNPPMSISDDAQNPEGHQLYEIRVENYYLFDSIDSKPSQKYSLLWGK